MLRIRVVQCLCTQCEGELLHLYEVCLPVISVEHMSQVQVWVVGPGFVSTSPDRARSPASHMRGSMGRLTKGKERGFSTASMKVHCFHLPNLKQ